MIYVIPVDQKGNKDDLILTTIEYFYVGKNICLVYWMGVWAKHLPDICGDNLTLPILDNQKNIFRQTHLIEMQTNIWWTMYRFKR